MQMNPYYNSALICQHEINNALMIILHCCNKLEDPNPCIINIQRVSLALEKMMLEIKQLTNEV